MQYGAVTSVAYYRRRIVKRTALCQSPRLCGWI